MNIQNTIVSLILVPTLMTVNVFPAYAQYNATSTSQSTPTARTGKMDLGTTNLINDANHMAMQASHAATVQQGRLNEIITRADTMITIRLNALQHLLMRIQNDQRLTPDEKTSLTTDIQSQITSLQTLKSKIDADTDSTTALTDAKQVITNYYIFAVYEPKMQLLITLNNLQTILSNVQLAVPQLQSIITKYGTGKDTTQLQSLLNDISTQLTTMTTAVTNDISTVNGISINNQTTAKTTVQQVRQDITTIVHTDFNKIRTDIGQMRPLLRALILPGLTNTTATSSAGQTNTGAISTSPIISVTSVPTIAPTQ